MRIRVDVHIFESGIREPRRQCARIDNHQSVEEMQEPKNPAIQAVGSRENTSRFQQPEASASNLSCNTGDGT
jgi:hypothetical protein